MSSMLMLAGSASAGGGTVLTAGGKTMDFESFNGTVNHTFSAAPLKTRAGESMTFTYAGELYSAASFSNVNYRARVWLGFAITVDDLKLLKGNKISALQYTSGVVSTNHNLSGVKEITIQIFKKLGEAPVYEQTSAVENKGYNTQTIELTTPYEITDTDGPLYITYNFLVPKPGQIQYYYIPYDGNTSVAPTACLAAIQQESNKTDYPANKEWQTPASQLGALVSGVVLTGDNLPQNSASPVYLDLPISGIANGNSVMALELRNKGANSISSVEVELTRPGYTPVTATGSFDKPLENNQTAAVTLSKVNLGGAGMCPVTARITKINGETNSMSDATTSDQFYLLNEGTGYVQNIVAEEGTGTWCGWCPAGIVLMEWLKEKYPDNIMRIAVHASQSQYNVDPMEVNSYMPYIHKFIEGFPGMMINRRFNVGVTSPNVNEYCEAVYNYYNSGKAYSELRFRKAEISSDGKKINIGAEAEFLFNIPDAAYQMAFAIVEDGYGPYDQTNYFAGGQYGSMGGWESKSSPVSTVYEDVARYLSGFPGNENSIPSNITALTPYTYELSLPLTAVKGDNFRIIGMIVDTKTGQIVNATRFTTSKSGVEDILTENAQEVSVAGGYGSITVTGAADAAVYTLAGVKVADGSAEGLAAGVYVVRADGKSYKVLVK